MVPLHATVRAAVVTFAIAAAAYAGLVLFAADDAWRGWLPARCGEYCEASHRCGEARLVAVHQPLNSWSNFAYLFVGMCAWWRQRTPQAALFWLSCAALCVGSFLFHASVTRAFRWLDVATMYGVLVALTVLALSTVVRARPFSVWIAVAVVADVLLAVFKWQLPTFEVLAGLVALIMGCMLATAHRAGRARRFGPLALATLVAGLVARELDASAVLCVPDSAVFQGHAVWHLLTAVASYCAYRYFEGVNRASA
ncbi:MAG: hypothetical protein B7733_23940 [Myxococcales bacterium FL481]|nr:MAG: hypothetical protein B7733_23940 [Myxococcales bacterium FL481]